MYSLTVLYAHPENPEAFARHYREVHAPLARALPGLTGFTMTWTGPGPDGSAPPYHLIAVLQTETEQAMQQALASPEGVATAKDLRNFAGAGVQMVFGATETVS